MSLVRKIGALALSAAAIAVFFLLSPKSPTSPHLPDPSSHSADISSAESSFGANDGSAQYIYGQIYAAGVATKDMATILAQQADEAAQQRTALERVELQRAAALPGPDERVPAELVLVLLSIALLVATTPRQDRAAPTSANHVSEGAILPA
jgi:hypothetical protein